MAKKRIKEYIFVPGRSALDNLFPNAYSLITSNKEFIKDEAREYIAYRVVQDTAVNYFPVAVTLLQSNRNFILAEMSAWIRFQISNNISPFGGYEYNDTQKSKCERDVGYLLDAYAYDLRYGGNEKTIEVNREFYINGVAQLYHIPQEVATHEFLTDLISNYVLKSILYPTKQSPIVQTQVLGVSGETSAISKAATLSNIARDVIANGLTSLPAVQFNLAFANYTYNAAKCERDVGYVLSAYLWDLRYGGNRDTRKVSEKYWVGNTPQVDGSRQPEIETHNFIKELINSYILTNTQFPYRQSPVATTQIIDPSKTLEAGSTTKIIELYGILSGVIQNGLSALPALISGVGIAYIQGKWTLDQILLITNVSKNIIIYNFADPGAGSILAYADPTTPDVDTQIDYGYTGIVLNFDTSNMDVGDDLQIFVEDYQELKVRPYDFGTDAIERQRVANAQSMLDADFEYGLQPTKWQALALARSYPGTYEVPGTELAVTAVTTDASAPTGFIGQSLITVTTEGAHGLSPGIAFTIKSLDSTVTGFSRAEGTFLCNTTPTSTTFTYYSKAKVGSTSGQNLVLSTTTFKRAKFFTGAAIGSPTFSIFSQGSSGEFSPALASPTGTFYIPYIGSIPVVNAPVIGSGYITPGTVITAVNGTGSPSSVQYTNLVGTNIGGIGVGATFNINRTSGVYIVTIATGGTGYAIGDQILFFGETLDGVTPGNDCLVQVATVDSGTGEILTITSSGTGIASGVTTSNQVQITAQTGTTVIEMSSTSGIIPGLAFNRGDGTPTVVTTVEGNTININRPLTANIVGSTATFQNVSPVDIVGSGTNATFNVTRTGTVYSATVANQGTDYQAGDSLIILGSSLGGSNGLHDLVITVSTVNVGGTIATFTTTGTGLDTNSFTNVATSNITGQGSGATFNVTRSNDAYSVVNINSTGLDYVDGDIIKINGLAVGGAALTNDITLTVTSVSVLGAILTYTFSGTAQPSTSSYTNPANTTNGVGTGATFNVTRLGNTYSLVTLTNAGDNTRTAKSFNVFGSTNISVTESKYGSSSLKIFNQLAPSTADSYVQVAANSDFDFGTAPFTIEFDIFKVGTGANQTILDMRQAEPDTGLLLGIDATEHLYIFLNGSIVATSTNPLSANTWHHIEISSTTRTVSGTTRIFVDGVVEASFTDTTNYGSSYSTVPMIIGANYTGAGDGFRGYIEEFRVSTSTARHTSAYTAPTSEFLHDSNTVMLLHFNGQDGSTVIDDDFGGYKTGDLVTILGSNLGGTNTTNDLTITITSTTIGKISTFNWAGAASDVSQYNAVSVANVSGQGSGLTFNITQNGTVYENISTDNEGSSYVVTDRIRITGTALGGATPANDIIIRITSASSTGVVGTFEILSGTAAASTDTYNAVTTASVESPGSGVILTVSKEAGSYSIDSFDNGGSGYKVGNRLKIVGNFLSGAQVLHDALVTVLTVDGTGAITDASISGTASGGETIDFYSTITLSDPIASTIPTNAILNFSAIAKIQVTFDNFHGLVPGSALIVQITSGGLNQNLAAGNFYVEEVPEPNIIRYTARAQGSISEGGLIGKVYSRTDAFFVHRPFDGGVQLGTGGPQHAAQAIRMSKNYIRYQSGKGLMYTTGCLFAPSYDLSSATADGLDSGSIITFQTDDIDHGLQIGAEIRILGVATSGYNNTYTVSNIIDEKTFQVEAVSRLGSKVAELDVAQVSLYQWSGATVRAGCFDEQNGMFWQYDGQKIAVGIRSATFQLAGTATATPDSNLITGLGTRFRDQLNAGDKIVIKGMTHTVSHVINQTTMYITPDFRGAVTVGKIKICKIVDRLFYQEEWNRDRADGTGPSGYKIDVTKMQMIGIQYTWYGAGFIDWMLRGKEGNFLFVHRVRNNNVNTEAFMRTANLPVRYEVINDGALSKLTSNITNTSTILPVEDTSNFPSSGVVYVDNELISYTGKSSSTLTGLTRSSALQNFVAGAVRTYTAGTSDDHDRGTGVILVSNKTSPNISHWGSAYLTDGGFDSDRGYLFNYQATSFIASTVRKTAFLIRLSPSVSNAVVGDLGTRDLINRAQLLLQGIEITAGTGSASGIVIEGILNPSNYPEDATLIDWRSLANPSLGGQPSFAQVALGTTVTWDNAFTVSFDASTQLQNRNRPSSLYFIAAETANVRLGMTVGSSTPAVAALIPGGTTVVGISGAFNISGINYREIYFNKQFTGNVNTGVAISFSSIASFASPGETIFSFVGLPNNQTVLDLTPLKEITNTAIGGRGVFPDGPDVLAINCYLTSGSDQEVSIVLRWSEAQA
jgi:hypothetical protein